jgi:hypothetical protein
MAGRCPDHLVEQFAADTHLYTSRELCEKYQRSNSCICDWRKDVGDRGFDVAFGPDRTIVQHGDVQFDVIHPGDNTIQDIEAALITLRRAGRKREIREAEAVFTFGSKPVMIVPWGDWHIGEKAMVLEQFQADKALIMETDGVFFIGMGDYKCNQGRAPFKAVNQELLPPGWQDMLVLGYAQELKGKALGWLIGCHDYWELHLSDRDFVSVMCERSEAKHLWHQAQVSLVFDGVVYQGIVRHKARRESILNTTNAQRAVYETWNNPDFVAIAHKHFADLQHKGKADKIGETVWVRSGCYVFRDEYGQRLGDYETEAIYPGIIFMPNQPKMVPFRNFKDGLAELTALRGEHD